MPIGRTAELPSWARANAAARAEQDESMAWLRGAQPAATPEEAYGFGPSGTTGQPGRIHGSTRQMDMTAMRAFRGSSATPGSPSMTSSGINSRVRGNALAGWAQSPPLHGEIRPGGDGRMWKYDSRVKHGVPIESGATTPSATPGGVALQTPTAAAAGPPAVPALAPGRRRIYDTAPTHMIEGVPAADWISEHKKSPQRKALDVKYKPLTDKVDALSKANKLLHP